MKRNQSISQIANDQAKLLSNPMVLVSREKPYDPFWKEGVIVEAFDKKHSDLEEDGNWVAAYMLVNGTHRPATEEEIAQLHADRKRRTHAIQVEEKSRKQQLVMSDMEAITPETKEALFREWSARMAAEAKSSRKASTQVSE